MTENNVTNEISKLAYQVAREFSMIPEPPNDVSINDDIVNVNNEIQLQGLINEHDINEKQNIDNQNNDSDEPDFKLHEVDWVNLEAKLKEAQIEVNNQNKRNFQNKERDEIRRKLAIVSSSSSSSSFEQNLPSNSRNNDNYMMSDYLRKNSKSKTNYLGQNLQICFMNDVQGDDLFENEIQKEESESPREEYNSQRDSKSQSISELPVFSFDENTTCDDLLSQHLNLQNKTKEALASVSSNVKCQIECEEILKRKTTSPIADIVGLPTYGLERLKREHIVDMNIGQLQVIVNDLCNQIENINEDLKIMLIDRDDMYMQQDSYLVDIEDVSKRIQEYAAKLKANSTDETNNPKIQNTTSEKTSPTSSNKFGQMSKFNAQFNILTNKIYQFASKKS